MVLINHHFREYSHFHYGNNLYPIIISSGMLSLMSFLIDCAVFTSFFHSVKTFFATIHHRGVLRTDLSSKVERSESQFRAVIQNLDNHRGNDAFINHSFTHESFWSTCENLSRAVEGWRCVENWSQGFACYLFHFSVSAFRLKLMHWLSAHSTSNPRSMPIAAEALSVITLAVSSEVSHPECL